MIKYNDNSIWYATDVYGNHKQIRKYNVGSLLFDFVMTGITGGFWLIWVLVRYARTH